MATGSVSAQATLSGSTNNMTVNLNCTMPANTYPTKVTLTTYIACTNTGTSASAVEIYLSKSDGSNYQNALLWSGDVPKRTSSSVPGTKNFGLTSASFTGTSLIAVALYIKVVKHSSSVQVIVPKQSGIDITTVTRTAVTAPTSVTAVRQTGYSYKVDWNQGGAGTDNAINGYDVLRNTSASTSGAVSVYDSTSTTTRTYSGSVTTGGTYYFGVRTHGALGSSFYSGYKWSSGLAIPTKPSVSAGSAITKAQMDNMKTWMNRTSNVPTSVTQYDTAKASVGNTYKTGLTAGTTVIDDAWYNGITP